MTPDAATVLAEMGNAASLRIVDLMQRTGLSRMRVHAELDHLRALGLVQAFAMGSRYSLRKPPFCPPAETHTGSSTLAGDTHQHPVCLCAGSLSTLGHTAGEAR